MRSNKKLQNFPKSCNSQRISCFDLDHTLLRGNCCRFFGSHLYRHGFLSVFNMLYSLSCYCLHKQGVFSIADLQRKIFQRFFLGLSQTVIQAQVKQFLDIHLNELIYPPAMERLRQAQRAGHCTVILSSSPGFLVGALAERLGVDVWDATEYAVDKNHCFCSIEYFMLSDDKADFIESLTQHLGVTKQVVTAYSDSILDLSFLQTAGQAVGVNPDRALRAHCLQNNWPII